MQARPFEYKNLLAGIFYFFVMVLLMAVALLWGEE